MPPFGGATGKWLPANLEQTHRGRSAGPSRRLRAFRKREPVFPDDGGRAPPLLGQSEARSGSAEPSPRGPRAQIVRVRTCLAAVESAAPDRAPILGCILSATLNPYRTCEVNLMRRREFPIGAAYIGGGLSAGAQPPRMPESQRGPQIHTTRPAVWGRVLARLECSTRSAPSPS